MNLHTIRWILVTALLVSCDGGEDPPESFDDAASGRVCVPGSTTCDGAAVYQCVSDGSEWVYSTTCEGECLSGSCIGCVPDCTGKACGDGGCADQPGACGTCAVGETCLNGTCTNNDDPCLIVCAGLECSFHNGCDCGTCPGDEECNDQGMCIGDSPCIPDCAGKDCGDDGCGGLCGTCDAGVPCQDGKCLLPHWTDPGSGLTWQNPPATETMDWETAQQYCASLTLDGGGWRLPTMGELRTLVRGCAAVETGGSCNMEEGICLGYSCRHETCDGCPQDQGPADGCYWPDEMKGPCDWYRTPHLQEAHDYGSWGIDFRKAKVCDGGTLFEGHVRCVR